MTNRSYAACTDTGLVRSVNQDSYYLDPLKRFFIVADGMGGHAGGQEASQIATDEIQTYLNECWDSEISSEELLQEAIARANERIIQDQMEHPERQEMGTTLVMILFRAEQAWRVHIGDSRLYRFREETLEQITEDHSYVARATRQGEMTKEEARVHPWRNILLQCLGRRDLRPAEVFPLETRPGDIFLLCSDGLTEEVTDEEIVNYLKEGTDCEEMVIKLVEAAKNAGGSDNITVVMVRE
ncbi:Stp1/IreP family PP2C-type Ser/Thr phosphatase [Pannus brasiliensis CCIBt3594]|uniref:Stp1/IreP family PP2C-type Ser/Thr phosphatase n=1 Tax=Pannus brasiliensis CCIBt3594 TaxID=1427578 RepID=A0AAW9QY65_9CHRO